MTIGKNKAPINRCCQCGKKLKIKPASDRAILDYDYLVSFPRNLSNPKLVATKAWHCVDCWFGIDCDDDDDVEFI